MKLEPRGGLLLFLLAHPDDETFIAGGRTAKYAGCGLSDELMLRSDSLHATLMRDMSVDGKLVADQLGHSRDVSQNVYTQSTVEKKKVIVDQLERALVM